jgi:integrase
MLTDIAIRNLKPGPKPRKIGDSGGLYILLKPTGARLWRLQYRFAGKTRTLCLGIYPTVSLAMAREERDKARKILAGGIDPAIQRRRDYDNMVREAGDTFGAIANAWLERRFIPQKPAELTIKRERRNIGQLAKRFGNLPITTIDARDLLGAIREIHGNHGRHDAARRMLNTASRVFEFAIAERACGRNSANDIARALTPAKGTRRPAITEPEAAAELMQAIGGRSDVMGLALQFLALTAVRPGNVAAAEWSEFDLDKAVWRIPAAKMKMRRDHEVPLSRQAVNILRQVWAINSGRRFVFSVSKDKPFHRSCQNVILQQLGIDTRTHCAHGFRSTFSTLLNSERRNGLPIWHPDVIELALAHTDGDGVRAAYNRATLWPSRVELMQHWADRIDLMRAGAKVLQLHQPHNEDLAYGTN